jgi:hypothetical protein
MPTLRLPAILVIGIWTLPGIVPRAAPEDPSRVATAMVGAELVYLVTPGDSLTLIGAELGVDPDVIARANDLTPTARLHPGDLLQVDNRHLVPPAEGRRTRKLNGNGPLGMSGYWSRLPPANPLFRTTLRSWLREGCPP